MSFWDAIDTAGLLVGVVWLAWFWYSASKTVLDLNYPRELRVGAWLRLAKGGLAFLIPLVTLLVIQHAITGAP